MTDEDLLNRTYGNQNLSEGTPERPLVTFALFAYNQEQYVREAIEGAFAQTYEPLEIILSDDCSTDRTFEIMQEMAAGYYGPHKVRIRTNGINLGTAAHFSLVAEAASGILVVVAAGDDISKPERTQRLVSRWRDSGMQRGIYHSNALRFVDGEPIFNAKQIKPKKILSDQEAKARIAKGGSYYILSPTFMYTKDFLNLFPPLLGGSIVEDGPMIYRCALTSKFIHTDEDLVYIRQGQGNSGTGLDINRPRHWNRLFRSRIMTGFNLLSDLKHLDDIGISYDRRVESAMTKRIRMLSKFILPEARPPQFIDRFRILANLALGGAYPSSPKANMRLLTNVLFGRRPFNLFQHALERLRKA